MQRRVGILAWVVVMAVMVPARALAQQETPGQVPFQTENWGNALHKGYLWGELYGGLSAQNSKKTFKTARGAMAKNWKKLNLTKPSPTVSFFGAQNAQASTSSSTLQLLGTLNLANFGFGNGDGVTIVNVMGGMRMLFAPRGRVMPYVQGQAGLQRSFGESALMIEPAGGVIFPAGKYFVNVGAGFDVGFYAGGNDTAFRMMAGLVFPFGSQ